MPYVMHKGFVVRALHDEKIKNFSLATFNRWAKGDEADDLVFSDDGYTERLFDTEEDAHSAIVRWASLQDRRVRIPLLTTVLVYKSKWMSEENFEKLKKVVDTSA